MVELMKQFNLEGASDKRRWEVIDNNFMFEQRRIADVSTRHDALGKDLYAEQLQYMKERVGVGAPKPLAGASDCGGQGRTGAATQ